MNSSTVLWNGAALTTTYGGPNTLTASVPAADLVTGGSFPVTVSNPSPGGGTSGAATFTVNAVGGVGQSVVSVYANSLAWDAVNQVIYLSLPSTNGANGNSVQILNPVSGTLGASAFAGSEPNLLAVSSTSKYLYVSLKGTNAVQRMTLPSLGTDIKLSLGSDSFDGPFYASDLQAAPAGADGTVAVVRSTPGFSPSEEGGVHIYDNGVDRAKPLCGWIEIGCPNIGTGLYDTIQWNTDGSGMYMGNTEDTGFDFYTVPVTTTGFGTPKDYGGVMGGFGESIHFDATTGYVYQDSGKIVDPSSGSIVGTFAASGLMVPDGKNGKAFFIGQNSNSGTGSYVLESFDINHFTPVSTVTIKNVVGTPTHLIRWGANGLAFTTESYNYSTGLATGAVYLISGTFVSGSVKNESGAEEEAPKENVQRTWPARRGAATPPAGDSTH